MKTRSLLMVLALLSWSVCAQADQMVYNANDEFSLTGNPNGAWTYGAYDFVTVDNGTTLFTTPDNWLTRPDALVNIDTWRMAGANAYDPSVTHNGSGAPITVFGFTWGINDIGLDTYGAGASIIQWTAPRAGTVVANAVFSPSAADAYVGFNGAVVNSQSNVAGTTWEYTFAVDAGDHVAVATAGAQTVTMFHGTITYVPEPSTLALLVTGLAGLLCYAWRKRN